MMAKDSYITFLLVWLPLLLFGDPIPLGNRQLEEKISLKPYLTIAEDLNDALTADQLYSNPRSFVALSQFKITKPDDSFWLRTTIETTTDLSQRYFSISFNHLTFVDLYLYQNSRLVAHKQAGTFREKKFIAPGDDRFTFNVILEPGAHYTLLLKVKHIKKYLPNFNFALQNTFSLLSSHNKLRLLNSFLLGAIAVLLFYTALLWLSNRYRPFLLLFLFMLGISLYSFALSPFFIDTFFPEHPETGWLMIFPFLHFGIIGFYLLMIDFLEMKNNAPILYTYSHYLIKTIVAFSLLGALYNGLTSNYYLVNSINLYLAPIYLGYISYILIVLRKKLNAAQHYLVYGILLFALAVVVVTISSFLFDEQSLDFSPVIANFTIVCISIVFLVGLHKQLQQHEHEKIIILEQLNDIQLHYNTMIEMKVEERTLELKNINEKLIEQQVQLIEKNRHIEILMDELNHRVKNNLQMLYSLNTLQLPLIKDIKSKQILNEMRGRIKAMMVVNEHLHAYKKDQSVVLSVFINEIIDHLQQIYDREGKTEITAIIPEDFRFDAMEALPLGLLLTELFTNTYKHAFLPLHPNPQIRLSLFIVNDQLRFIFKDNGLGADHCSNGDSMGISLIQDLTRQLKGTVTFQHQQGFSYQFTFSNTKHHAHINN